MTLAGDSRDLYYCFFFFFSVTGDLTNYNSTTFLCGKEELQSSVVERMARLRTQTLESGTEKICSLTHLSTHHLVSQIG